VGIDNINSYYDVNLKYNRLENCGIHKQNIQEHILIKSTKWDNYNFVKIDLEDSNRINELFYTNKFEVVIHLAAQAGVRYSLENPKSYIQSNITGYFNILEACKNNSVQKLMYASSSSVYGISENERLSETDITDFPVSMYAATKKTNELMSYVYSNLYNFQTIGLRFFTVYGPWGRPDMAPFLFADAIINGKEINVFNNGEMQRDFTYIDDIIEGLYNIFKSDIVEKSTVFNIGNNKPVKLMHFIKCLQSELKTKPILKMKDMQPGDVKATWANIDKLILATSYEPRTNIEQGVKKFIIWYKDYFKIMYND
jgi:UDP-glucuronate 4-epimerase